MTSLAPGGIATWNIDITASPPPLSDTALVLRVDYTTTGAAGRADVSTATVEVKAPPQRPMLDDIDKLRAINRMDPLHRTPAPA